MGKVFSINYLTLVLGRKLGVESKQSQAPETKPAEEVAQNRSTLNKGFKRKS